MNVGWTMGLIGVMAAVIACGGAGPSGSGAEAKSPESAAGAASTTGGPTAASGSTAGLKPFQKDALQSFDTALKDKLDATNKACGVTIKLTSDFSAYNEEAWAGQSVSGRCESVLDAIIGVCGKPNYKTELAKNLTEVKCLFGGTSTDTKANMTFANKVMTFKMNKDNANIQDTATAVIQNKLDGK